MQKKRAVDLVNVLKITCSILKTHVDANSLYPNIDREQKHAINITWSICRLCSSVSIFSLTHLTCFKM